MGLYYNYEFKNTRWPERKRKFLEALREAGNVRVASEVAGISRRVAYAKKGKDAKFSADWDAAYAEAADRLEQEAWRRAVEGVEEPVVSMGKLVYGEDGKPIALKKYSDTLMLALLKGAKPEKYADRRHVEFDVSDKLAEKLEAARQRALPKPEVTIIDVKVDDESGS